MTEVCGGVLEGHRPCPSPCPTLCEKGYRMRFMDIHKSNEANEAGIPPSKELIAAMGKLMEETAKSGVLLAGEGVHASSKGVRLSFSGGKRTITDGPFAEAKELIAGFAILEVPSKQEAIEWASRFAK